MKALDLANLSEEMSIILAQMYVYKTQRDELLAALKRVDYYLKYDEVDRIMREQMRSAIAKARVTKTGQKVDIERGCPNCRLCPRCGLVMVFCKCKEF